MSLDSLEKLLQHRSRSAFFHVNYQNVILYKQLEHTARMAPPGVGKCIWMWSVG